MCTRLLSLCCGLDDARDVASPQTYEESLLLNPNALGSKTSTPRTASNDGPPEATEQNVYIMRHGHRQDEEDDHWHLTASRPWDPPLSELGRKQAREAAVPFKDLDIHYVLTSPFLRCLQTSAEIVDELGLPQGRWLAVWPMCELCDPRLLLAGRDDVKPTLGKRPIREWMWEGAAFDEAVGGMLKPELSLSGVRCQPELWSDCPPQYPEKIEGALKRYEKFIKYACKDFAGRNILIVTHGEALRAAVNMYDTRAAVYEVRHTGHVPLRRTRKEGGAWGQWSLCCTSGQTGVHWSYLT